VATTEANPDASGLKPGADESQPLLFSVIANNATQFISLSGDMFEDLHQRSIHIIIEFAKAMLLNKSLLSEH
jgi:hypothetical protein